jgi:hypothetical protein
VNDASRSHELRYDTRLLISTNLAHMRDLVAPSRTCTLRVVHISILAIIVEGHASPYGTLSFPLALSQEVKGIQGRMHYRIKRFASGVPALSLDDKEKVSHLHCLEGRAHA